MRRVAPRFLERSAASLPFEASPNEFQRKLNVSGFTRAKNLTYGRIGYVSHGVGEVRLVKGVEELGSELHPEPFSKREIFEEGEVPILEARSIQNASSRVAKARVPRREVGKQELVGKTGGIEPALHCSLARRKRPVASPVGPPGAGPDIRHVIACAWSEGEAGLKGCAAGQLPTPDDAVQ